MVLYQRPIDPLLCCDQYSPSVPLAHEPVAPTLTVLRRDLECAIRMERQQLSIELAGIVALGNPMVAAIVVPFEANTNLLTVVEHCERRDLSVQVLGMR
jgi:hypothetical protein